MKWRQWRKHLFQAETWREIGCLKTDLQVESFDFVLDSQGLIKSACFAKMAKSLIYGLDKHSARESLAAFAYSKTFAVPKGKMRSGETVNYSPKYLVIQCLRRRYLVCQFLNQAV